MLDAVYCPVSPNYGPTISCFRETDTQRARRPPEVAYPDTCPQEPDAVQVADQAGPPALCSAHVDGGPVFGQINQGRGFLQFLLRHLEKVNGEWSLICTVRDLLKLFRFVRPVVNYFQSAIQMP